VEHPFNTSLLK